MKPRNILIVAPPFIPTSANSVAGMEQMAFILGKALKEQGNNVTTVAREDSQVYGELIPGGLKDVQIQDGAELEHFHQALTHASSVVRRTLREQSGIDVIIDRCFGTSLIVSHEENGPPVICALDMEPKYFLDPLYFNKLRAGMEQRKDSFAAVANHIARKYVDRLSLDSLKSRMNTIHNGIITEDSPFSGVHGDYLLYLGRIREGKAPHLAIQVARDSGHKIIVAGGNLPGNNDGQYTDEEYFGRHIKPLLNDSVEWYGPADLQQKTKLLRNARGVLFPSQHVEAFPLVPLEAMACGTPVIAFDHSGAQEQILNGQTGYLVSSLDNMTQAISRLPDIDRAACRRHVEAHFDYRTMGEAYSQLIDTVTK